MQKIFNSNLIMTIFAAAILFLAACIIMPKQSLAFSGGDGSEGSPYMIENCLQLSDMQNDLSANYLLIDDIDCSDTVNWNGFKGFDPVGDDNTAPFTGVLDGNSKTISDLYMNWADDSPGNSGTDRNYVGLFGYISGAEVKDLNLENIKSKGYEHVGGVAGYALSSTITNVNVNTELEDNNCAPGTCIWARWGTYGGGIVGTADATSISSVTTGGPVKGSGTHIGGIAGQAINSSVIANATSSSHVDGGYRIGGIAGYLDNSSISSSTASGRIECVTDDGYKQGNYAGGLVGEVLNGGTVQSSHASGYVTGYGTIGGLIGNLESGTVGNSSATGNVEGYANVGGFLGAMSDGQVYYSYAKGEVSNGYNIAGFVGLMIDGEISNSYSQSKVLSEGYAGGFIAIFYGGSVSNSYAAGVVTSTASFAGVGGFVGYAIGTGEFSESFSVSGVNAKDGLSGFVAETSPENITFSNNYYDIWRTGQTDCRYGGDSLTGCTGVNNDNLDPNYFIGNSTSAIFANWDFGGIWQTVEGGLPCLAWQDDCVVGDNMTRPVIECLQPSSTVSSVTAICTTVPALQGENVWNLQYRTKNSTNWINLDDQSGDTFNVTINGLNQATTYEIRFRYQLGVGKSDWGLVEAKTDSDLNGDGISDLDQPNVSASVNPETGKYVLIDVGADCILTSVDMVKESDLAAQDPGFNYDNGLFDFTADCSAPTTTIKLYYYGVSKNNVVARKYNPVNNSFVSLTGVYGATIEEQTINGQTVLVVSYQFSDNGPLDSDPTVGHIADPAGLAQAVIAAPNTGLGLQ